MNKDMIFTELKKVIVEFVPDINEGHIKIEDSLKDLGTNSVDRMDIIIGIMEILKVKIPLVQFGNVNNIQGIVDLLHRECIS